MAKVKPRWKKGLIKKGTPHPTKPSFKFDSAHLKESDAEKVADKIEAPTDIILVPRQHLVYKHTIRITPKRPKLRR